MPLRDHFRSPLDDVRSWDELHGGWPMVIVQHLSKILPEPYFAGPGVYLGRFEVDIGTFDRQNVRPSNVAPDIAQESGTAVMTYAPPKPTSILEPRLPNQDVYEVRVFDSKRNRRLVAAIEIVSPSNKDRPENRAGFVSKVAKLLYQDVSVSIVDIVTTSHFSLYEDLLTMGDVNTMHEGRELSTTYAVTMRMRYENTKRLMDSWHYPLAVGLPLPTLPIWLSETLAVGLELEAVYEDTCKALRIG